MSSNVKGIVIAAIAVGLAVFWFWPRERGGEAAQPQSSSHGQADRTPTALAEQSVVEPQRSGVPDAGTGLRVEVAPPAPDARRVVSESGRAIEGARAFVLREDGCPRPGAPLGVSDAEGWLRMAAGSSARWEGVVVLGRGHVPTRAADHDGGLIVMKVAPGLTGRAADRTGQPLAGVKVVVSRAPVSRARHDVALDSDHGVVFERAPDGLDVQGRDGGSRWQHGAVFAATSAADGSFQVDGLAAGTYCIDVSHDTRCIVDNGLAGSCSIDIPHQPLRVIGDSLYRAAVRVDGAELSTVTVHFPSWASLAPATAQSMQRLRQRLGVTCGWTGSSAQYHMPPGPDPVPPNATAKCVLYFYDASMQVVDVPVRPLEEQYEHRLSVAADGAPPASVAVVVRDSRGSTIDGLECSLGRVHRSGMDVHSEYYAARHGQQLRIPAGTYELRGPNQLVNGLLRQTEVTLDQSVRELLIEISEPLFRVRFTCDDFSRGECDVTVVKNRLRSSQRVRDGSGAAVWLPAGSFTVWISRVGMVAREVAFESGRHEGELVVAVPRLEPKL
jgi:hypothetical protein